MVPFGIQADICPNKVRKGLISESEINNSIYQNIQLVQLTSN